MIQIGYDIVVEYGMGGKVQKHQGKHHRAGSNHNPVMLESGNWEHRNPYLKSENWWLKVDGFNDMVQGWWDSFEVVGCPVYKLSNKLRMLKQKLKEQSRKNFSETIRKNGLLEELAELDRIQNERLLNDEMVVRATILLELKALAKQEEASWIQKSRVLWLKQGARIPYFFKD